MNVVWVFLGGGIGSLLRYGFSLWLTPKNVSSLPWGTIVANSLACLFLGFFMAWAQKNALPAPFRLFFMVGLCGGFSTFSTFSAENIVFLHAGEYRLFILNTLLSLVLGMLLLFLAYWWWSAE